MRSCSRLLLTVVLIIIVASSFHASRALADEEILKHGFLTVVVAPLEFVVSPYVAADTLFTNMRVDDYSPPAQVAFAVPGFAWLWIGQIGVASGRAMSSAVEMTVGLPLMLFNGHPDPLLDLEREPALVESSIEPLRFGIYYARRE